MTYIKLPTELLAEVVRQQEKMGWPDLVPAFAEIKRADGKTSFMKHGSLTVSDCEQLVQQHVDAAWKALDRYAANSSQRTLKRAAHHVLYARLYRCTYISLTGKEDSTEIDMPFPIADADELNELLQRKEEP